MKASSAPQRKLTDLPNIGKTTAAKLEKIGISLGRGLPET